MTAKYADRRLTAEGRVVQADTTVLTADVNYPIDLALQPRDKRVLDDTMRVSINSPSVGLDILESFTTKVRDAAGTFKVNAELAGRTGTAKLNGVLAFDASVTLPDLGITLPIHADLSARNVRSIDTLVMGSGPHKTPGQRERGSPEPFNAEAFVRLDLDANGSLIGNRDWWISASRARNGRTTFSSGTGSLCEAALSRSGNVGQRVFISKTARSLGIDSAVVGRSAIAQTRRPVPARIVAENVMS